MATSIPEKLKIKAGYTLLTVNAPGDFKNQLGKLPAEVTVTTNSKAYQQIHWFVLNKAQLEKELSRVMKLLREDVIVWVYYPKGSSKIQTDLTRDKGWDCLLNESDKVTWISLISFNETWSVFGFRPKTAADKKKEAQQKERVIFKWINAETKEIKLPEDLAAVFRKNKKEAAFFETLSFTNKKEYLEWVVTAKRPETRAERISGTIERLTKLWKNPRHM
jgi:hypothetical protein